MLFQTCITFLKVCVLCVCVCCKSYRTSPVCIGPPLPSIMDQDSGNIIDINPKLIKVFILFNEGTVSGLLKNKYSEDQIAFIFEWLCSFNNLV